MKSYAFIFFAAILSIFISCEKSALSEDSEVVEPIPVETFSEGKILAKKGELCLFGRDFEMHPVIKLATGTDISVLELDGVIDVKFVPEKMKRLRIITKNKLTIVQKFQQTLKALRPIIKTEKSLFMSCMKIWIFGLTSQFLL